MPIIQSLDRALRILDLFDESEPELKISEISGKVGLHKSTVHSLLKTLQQHGYIEQRADSGKYRLGFKLVERGNLLLQSMDIRTIAGPLLRELSVQTGQTAHLVVLDGKEGVYVDKVEGQKAVIRYSRVGRRVSLHSSAVGKALAAFRGDEALEEMLDGYSYRKQTARTIESRERFRIEVEAIRRRGYAVDDEENEPGVRCVAAPVRDHTGQTVAAVSLSTLVSAVGDAELQSCIDMLLRAARDISRQLGYGIGQ